MMKRFKNREMFLIGWKFELHLGLFGWHFEFGLYLELLFRLIIFLFILQLH
jgi:hypothetical protein